MKTEYTEQNIDKKKEYINIKIKIHNLQNQTKAYKIYKHIYNDKKKWNQKNMKDSVVLNI